MSIKPKTFQLAKIDETLCIGCTKCIQACPVDSILGSMKQMHVILDDECIGCGLCVTPCPVDCIQMLDMAVPTYNADKAKQRHKARKARLAEVKLSEIDQYQQAKITIEKTSIAAAVARAKSKKMALKQSEQD